VFKTRIQQLIQMAAGVVCSSYWIMHVDSTLRLPSSTKIQGVPENLRGRLSEPLAYGSITLTGLKSEIQEFSSVLIIPENISWHFTAQAPLRVSP
jgi:hypothetical protein